MQVQNFRFRCRTRIVYAVNVLLELHTISRNEKYICQQESIFYVSIFHFSLCYCDDGEVSPNPECSSCPRHGLVGLILHSRPGKWTCRWSATVHAARARAML